MFSPFYIWEATMREEVMAIRTAQTLFGNVSGISGGNPSYTVFKGIPYAAPPVGERRWQAPADPDAWEGVRKCDTFPPISIQSKSVPGDFYQKEFFPVQAPMSEDCLYLNVWTPANHRGDKLPVMVWIHGGAYLQGYGHEMEFDGEAFCKRGVILVTINYRLGVMGYFVHPALSHCDTRGVSGNYGLLDQIQALKWVSQNIEAFGGDPGNVTVFGQSAGGDSVISLCASPLTEGLIHKAIIQSAGIGGIMGDDYTLSDAENFGVFVTEYTGLSLDELRELPAEILHEKALAANSAYEGHFAFRFRPCIDHLTLYDDPGKIISEGKHLSIPYMAGIVSGDRSFISEASMGWHKLKKGSQPLYVYCFDRDIPGEDKPGAFHSSELWYIFGTLARCWRPMCGVDYDLSLKMTDYWTSFAKNADPNGNGWPEWTPHSEQSPTILEIK